MGRVKCQQLFRCRYCGYEYRPALRAIEVICPRTHRNGRGTVSDGPMDLVEGEPYVQPNKKKKVTV